MNLTLKITPVNSVWVSLQDTADDQLVTSLTAFYTGPQGPQGPPGNGDASTTAITPVPAVGLDSTNAQDGFQELAGDIHDLNNGPDLVLLYQNALL